ncbi:alpha subunit of methylmalonyl-CoA decarboxylase [Aspergillus violaceofuscus CBS 115571]|uniref:Alpha subunit of methylmalonyl-CoA decarboxylase n=1 Tax=Aspergillus violaceofuscus (strain CBS 115571) TaxID=1450538 RepID=A0A2V5GTK1_ASPV1|nr:alpha subunit of methylmalonyl-CoA decarboxylase [Aspergillus violaceofuscus CBS 115571]
MPDDNSDSDAKDTHPSSATASKRLRQVASHLPADYSDVLAQIETLRSIAATPDAFRRGYIRQKQAGKLWVRERLDALLDPGSFQEIGSLSGTVTWEQTGPMREKPVAFVPSNNVQGTGRLRGRRVLLTADDFTLRSGHADGASHEKTIYIEKLALALKLPIVKLVDGSSGGGSVTLIRSAGYSYLPYVSMYKYVVEQLNQGIPNLGAVVGPAIGLGAARVVSCHFSVMAADVGSLFNAGQETLGGPVVHCTNGTIDNVAANEAECYEQLRTVLGYLPYSGREAPPVIASEDPADREDEALRRIIPRRQTRMYNPWTIIRSVVDCGSWFEIGPLWGRTAIGGLARLDGRPVGVVSLNCEVNGGALDAAGSQKLARLLKLCDVMNLPVLQFIDVPGYAIGTVAERTATMRWGVELGKTYFTTTTPLFNVIVRRAYGVAGGLMLGARDPVMQMAWPSGQWGSLPLEGGIEVAHRQELREAELRGEKAARYRELEEEYRRLMNPVRTANAFGVEEIIDPKDTRRVCCAWARQVYGTLMAERLADRAAGKIRPVFA